MERPGRNLKIIVMAHSGATDMEPIALAIEKGELHAEITALICDKADAYAITRAENHGIPAIFIDPAGKTKEKFNEEIMQEIERYEADLILLLGWMKILGSGFVNKYGGLKTWNIHPALLPMFAGGMDRAVHEEILKRGAKITGCSLIALDEGADTGPIILEKVVKVKFNDTVDTLRDRVQEAEQKIILEAILLFIENKLRIETNVYGGKSVRILE